MQLNNAFGLSLLGVFFLCQAGQSFPAEINKGLTGKIAFLKNGEVWSIGQNGKEMHQITRTNGKVEDFLFSPNLEYLAYSKVIRYVDEPGLWEDNEKIPQRSVCSIVIVNLKTLRKSKEIMPGESNGHDTWIYMTKWLTDEKLLCYDASGFDVSGFFEYDFHKNVTQEIDYHKGNQLSRAEFSNDGLFMVYVDDAGTGDTFTENLHWVDLKTKDDRIIASKKSILEPAISCKQTAVAFIEVEEINGKYFDNLWIYNTEAGSLKNLYREPAKAKSVGVNRLAWSFDGRYLAIFSQSEALVLEIQNPGNIHKICGKEFAWIPDNRLIFTQGNDLYFYNLDLRKSEVFIKNASHPVFSGF